MEINFFLHLYIKMKALWIFLFIVLNTPVSAQDTTSKLVICYIPRMPEFPQGDDSLSKFIKANIIYPDSAKSHNIQGRVVIGFTVVEDGSVSNVAVKKSVSWDIDAEAIRVVKLLPKFNPGMIQGKPDTVNFLIPMVFTLTDPASSKPHTPAKR